MIGSAVMSRVQKSLGVIGFGAFGQLAAKYLHEHFSVAIYDLDSSKRALASRQGFAFVDLSEVAASDVILMCVPIRHLRGTVRSIAPFLRPGALVVDVCSVKSMPASILDDELPDYVDVLCTHPLFGPQSARNGIAGLKIVVCPTRSRRWRLARRFLDKHLSLKVIISDPEMHDREMATVQGLTHLIAKVLVRMEPLPREMVTLSFEHLLKAMGLVRYDSDELFRSIEQDNPFAAHVTDRFFELARELQYELEHQSRSSRLSRSLEVVR
jgi:prephenate dehydrogenase